MPSKELIELAARCLLDKEFIQRDINEVLEEYHLAEDEEKTVVACWNHGGMRTSLESFHEAYEKGRAAGEIPAVREPWYD